MGGTIPSETERQEVINSSIEVINSITYPLRVWGPLLRKRQYSSIDLRMRALPIVVCCLFDIAEAPNKHLVKHINKCDEWPGRLSFNLRMLAQECRYAAEALISLPYQDQIFLRLTRNRMVHGYLGGNTGAHQRMKVVDRFGIGNISVTNAWASEILGEQSNLPPDLLNIERLTEILGRFDILFERYLEQTKEHLQVDIAQLRHALENDYLIFFTTNNSDFL